MKILFDQQNLGIRRIGILVLTTTSWPKIERKVAAVVAAVEALSGGGYLEVAI